MWLVPTRMISARPTQSCPCDTRGMISSGAQPTHGGDGHDPGLLLRRKVTSRQVLRLPKPDLIPGCRNRGPPGRLAVDLTTDPGRRPPTEVETRRRPREPAGSVPELHLGEMLYQCEERMSLASANVIENRHRRVGRGQRRAASTRRWERTAAMTEGQTFCRTQCFFWTSVLS
jgi:hypothetical protein